MCWTKNNRVFRNNFKGLGLIMKQNYAIILAAGIGSRLYPLTQEYPKSLVKVNGREILDYQIQGYLKAGIKEENIYIVTGYKHEMITEYLCNHYSKVNEIYSPDYLTTNNMYSLYLGLNEINKLGLENINYLFINNADCLYDEQLMSEFVNSEYESAIAVEIGTYIEESMKVVQNQDGSLNNIAKTILEKDSVGVSVDLYKYSQLAVKRLFEIVKDYIEVKKDLKQWTEVAFPELFKTEKVYPFDIKHKKWVEVDNNDDLLLADKLFSNFDISKKKLLICDMDGTLYIGDQPIQNAIDFVNSNQNLKYKFLTNNTSKVPSQYYTKLREIGISHIQEDDILTPLYPLINYIKSKNIRSIYLVATNLVKMFLMIQLPETSFEYDTENNQAVILTYDTEIDYEKLKNICILLNNNREVEYLATHSDIFCPSEQGAIPDIGSYIELVKTVTKKSPDVIFGKPNIELVKELLSEYSKDEIAVVGDRLYTDKKLADNIGCDFICVLSGETTRLDVQNYTGTYPDIVLRDLGYLN